MSGPAGAPGCPPALELIQRLRPVLAQQTRQGAIGEQAAAGLARRTVVRFVPRGRDPLNGRAAPRTGLAVPPVRRDARPGRRHFFGKRAAPPPPPAQLPP